jgi:molybdopterin-guanine dinucleotide biosynthesis protein A
VCAAYRRTALLAISAALDAGDLKLSNLAERLDVTWLEGLDSDLFRSLNTPDAYERFCQAVSAQY